MLIYYSDWEFFFFFFHGWLMGLLRLCIEEIRNRMNHAMTNGSKTVGGE